MKTSEMVKLEKLIWNLEYWQKINSEHISRESSENILYGKHLLMDALSDMQTKK